MAGGDVGGVGGQFVAKSSTSRARGDGNHGRFVWQIGSTLVNSIGRASGQCSKLHCDSTFCAKIRVHAIRVRQTTVDELRSNALRDARHRRKMCFHKNLFAVQVVPFVTVHHRWCNGIGPIDMQSCRTWYQTNIVCKARRGEWPAHTVAARCGDLARGDFRDIVKL